MLNIFCFDWIESSNIGQSNVLYNEIKNPLISNGYRLKYKMYGFYSTAKCVYNTPPVKQTNK